MARSAFLPAIALLALAPSAGAQVVIGGPADVSVDLSALDRLRPPSPPLVRNTITAPAAVLPALPAPLAQATLTVRSASVLRPVLPTPDRGTLTVIAPLERAQVAALDLARVAPPRIVAPALDRPVGVAPIQPDRIERTPIAADALLRLPVGLEAPTQAALRQPAELREAPSPSLTARLHLQRASLRAPDAQLPQTLAPVTSSTVPSFVPRYVLAAPRLERPSAPALDALPKLDGAVTPTLLRDAVLTAPAARAVDTPPVLADRAAPDLAARTVLAQARLTMPSAGALAALPDLKAEATPRLNAPTVTVPAETLLRTATLAVAEPAQLRALPSIATRDAPDLDTPVVRASLRAPNASIPSAPSQLPDAAAPNLQARPVLLAPVLDVPARQLPDAPLQLEHRSQTAAPAALFASNAIAAPAAASIEMPREVASREAPSLHAAPYLLRVALHAPQAELPQLRAAVSAGTPPLLTTRLLVPVLATPSAGAIERATPLAPAVIEFAAPVHSAAHVVAPEPRALRTPLVLDEVDPPALRATARALPAHLNVPQAATVDPLPALGAASAPALDNVVRVVAPQFELAVVRPAAPDPLPPSLAPQLETEQLLQNAVLREPPPSSAAAPVINERLAFVAQEPPPPAALGPTPKIPAPRTTPPSSTKVPPKPGPLDGTAPPPHAATPADPNPVAPQAVPAPNIASSGPKSVLTSAPPEKGERSAVRLQFGAEMTALPVDVETALAPIVTSLQRAPKSRIILRGYASGGDTGGRAKRIALTRALELRNFFIAHGIDGARIDVRALGAPDDNSVADRVDIGLLD